MERLRRKNKKAKEEWHRRTDLDGSGKKERKQYTLLKPHQLRTMKAYFKSNQYLNNEDATKLAQEIQLDRKILYVS